MNNEGIDNDAISASWAELSKCQAVKNPEWEDKKNICFSANSYQNPESYLYCTTFSTSFDGIIPSKHCPLHEPGFHTDRAYKTPLMTVFCIF